MKTMSQFFQGPIARDYNELQESDLTLDAAAKKKPAKKEPAKKEKASSPPNTCTVGPTCKTKKQYAPMPDVAGWSMPPAPPQL